MTERIPVEVTAYDRLQRMAATMPVLYGEPGRGPDIFITLELEKDGPRLHGVLCRKDRRKYEASHTVTWRELALCNADPLPLELTRLVAALRDVRNSAEVCHAGR